MEKNSIKLTKRQTEILQWVAEGKTDWEIGKILNFNKRTTSNYLRIVYLKMGVYNRVQAVVKAIRLGLIK